MDSPVPGGRVATAEVRRKLEELAGANRTGELIEMVLHLLEQMQDQNSVLAGRLHQALRALYGRRSEKMDSAQLAMLFGALDGQVPDGAAAALVPAPAPAAGEQAENVEQPSAPPKAPSGQRGRRPLPASLPRELKEVRVPDAERPCPQCGLERKCIGHVVSEVLEFIPSQFKVIEERREKLACSECVEGIVVAQSEKVMDKGRPGPCLLANLIVDKFSDAMPVYRQSQAFARAEVPVSDSTLGDWLRFGLEVLTPLAVRIRELVISDSYVAADDTGLRVLDRQHPEGVKRGHLWAYVAMQLRLLAFDYTPTWEASGPELFLRDFRGFLHTDGYAGFEGALELPKGVPAFEAIPSERRLGCGMHIRRKFEEAQQAGDLRGAIAMAYFKKVYRLEAQYKADGLSHEARLLGRQKLSLPVVDELYAWINDIHPRLVPKTPLYKATGYALNQEDAWRLCFTQGRFEIDNGEVERQLRPVGTGRKNYLFAGSDAGAKRLAIGYTIIGSCRMQELNPIPYLADVIQKLQAGWPKSRLDELLPHRWRPGLLHPGPLPALDAERTEAARPEPPFTAHSATPAAVPSPPS